MSLLKLNLKAQGLVALLFCVFTSCDQLLPTAGSGVDIPVKIRAVNVAGGSQTEITTRASGGEKRIIGQPIIQDFGDGMLAEITVEEDVEALRDATPLGSSSNTVRFRVIALDSDNKVYSYADYTAVSGSIAKVDNSPELHVVSGVTYNFICFSYNSTTLPSAPKEGEALGDIALSSARDFLYEKKSANLSATNNNLTFNLTHQLAKVNLTFTVNHSSWTISSVSTTSGYRPTFGSVAIPSSFAHGASTLSGGIADTQSFPSFQKNSTSTQASSAIRLVPVSGSNSYTLTIPRGALTLSGSSYTRHPTTEKTVAITTKLEKATSYTLNITLKEYVSPHTLKFAGSNIYWDGSKLTFDPHGDTSHEKYQGVYFRWGSLVGISAVSGNYSSNATTGTVLYWPDNITDRTWKEVKGVAWDDIPSCYDKYTSPPTSYSDEYLGDICTYINSYYRMPTKAEYDEMVTSTFTGFTPSTLTSSDPTGRMVLSKYATIGGYIFPASGLRTSSDGTLDLGRYCYWWSRTANYSSRAAHLLRFIGENDNFIVSNTNTKVGMPVRCILP